MKRKNIEITLLIILLIFVAILLIIIPLVKILGTTKDNYKIGPAGISYEEFEKIQIGMSNFEVNDIIDNENLWNDDDIYNTVCIENSRESKNHVYSYSYKYLGENSGYAIITFTTDYTDDNLLKFPEVSQKENFGLK